MASRGASEECDQQVEGGHPAPLLCPVTDDAVDYENSPAIHTWKLQQAEALQTESTDDEPDYVNAAPAPLSKQRIVIQEHGWGFCLEVDIL
ncbi:linker for activation of t-cells family member 2 [Limosa lapponica baueri]|uniref:Linker for activation of t-cells family member 2 n=1 Tax=Limosa lapponica baueri TaxID=1758121 RepID=A0A2I0TAX9_LIMLA|nr:linker for activation of t-cells family member 2 [Limosa lapponica baueri]